MQVLIIGKIIEENDYREKWPVTMGMGAHYVR